MPIAYPKPRHSRHSLPPAGLQQLLDRAPQGSLRPALEQTARAYESVLARHRTIAADATISEAARVVRAAREARRLLDPALATLQAARKQASEARADAQRRMQKLYDPIRTPTTHEAAQLGSEIRFKLLGMQSGERLARLRQAIEAGDELFLRAVAVAPADLLELPAAMHGMARDRLISMDDDARAARDAVATLDEQERAAQQIENVVMQSAADLIDFVAADSFAAAAADAVAA